MNRDDDAHRGRGAAGRGALLLARAIRLIAGMLAALIGLGIVFVVLKANRDNSIVSFVLDLARSLVGPFDGIFKIEDRRGEVAVDWGIALVVYLAVGALLSGLVARLARSGTQRSAGD